MIIHFVAYLLATVLSNHGTVGFKDEAYRYAHGNYYWRHPLSIKIQSEGCTVKDIGKELKRVYRYS